MIVKNDQAVLARCLNSVKDIVDEIIIIDTGSNDRTKEIAKGYTNTIFDFHWIDDYSSARNYSFFKATKEYILWLDADDILLEEDRVKLIWFKQNLDKAVDVVMMKYNVCMDEVGKINLSYYREGLLKRLNNYKWKDPVHEYLEISGNVIKSDINIWHKKKYEPMKAKNIYIYEKIISKGKKLSTRSLYYFAEELYYSNRYEDAINYFEKFLDTGEGGVEENIRACYDLSICYKNENNNKSRIKTLLKSFEYDIPRGEICCGLGEYYFENMDYEKAIFWYKTAIGLKRIMDSFMVSSSDYCEGLLYTQLSKCYDKLGNR